MWPSLQVTADLVTFAEGILNEKLHFLCNERAGAYWLFKERYSEFNILCSNASSLRNSNMADSASKRLEASPFFVQSTNFIWKWENDGNFIWTLKRWETRPT